MGEAIIQFAVAAVLTFLGAHFLEFLAPHVPYLALYLGSPVVLAIPVWGLWSIGLAAALSMVVPIFRWIRRTRHEGARVAEPVGGLISAAPEPPLARATPQFYPISHLDLNWEIQPGFFDVFRTLEDPDFFVLDELIKGPLCPRCNRLLKREVRRPYHVLGDERYAVQSPCPNCAFVLERPAVLQASLHQVKTEVYREAQTRARSGRFIA